MGYVFFGGGRDNSGNRYNAVEIYKIEDGKASLWRWSEGNNSSNTDTWIEPLKIARQGMGAASIVVNNVGYVFFGGGWDGSFYNAVEVYKVEDNNAYLWRWSEGNDPSNTDTYIAPLTVARNHSAAASVVVDEVGYVFFAGGSNSNAVDVYTLTETTTTITTTTLVPLS